MSDVPIRNAPEHVLAAIGARARVTPEDVTCLAESLAGLADEQFMVEAWL